MIPMNAHRWVPTEKLRGRCSVDACRWSGTRVRFYREHLYRLVVPSPEREPEPAPARVPELVDANACSSCSGVGVHYYYCATTGALTKEQARELVEHDRIVVEQKLCRGGVAHPHTAEDWEARRAILGEGSFQP